MVATSVGHASASPISLWAARRNDSMCPEGMLGLDNQIMARKYFETQKDNPFLKI